MKLSNLDRHPNGSFPLALALQWLDKLTTASGLDWNPAQLAAARAVLGEARELMDTPVLTLAARHFPNAEPARMVDKAEGIREAAESGGVEYLLPYNAADRDADWDSLVKGTVAPWGLEGDWKWCSVVVRDAPGLRAHDLTAEGYDEAEAVADNHARHEVEAVTRPELQRFAHQLAGDVVERPDHSPILELMGDRCQCARCAANRPA